MRQCQPSFRPSNGAVSQRSAQTARLPSPPYEAFGSFLVTWPCPRSGGSPRSSSKTIVGSTKFGTMPINWSTPYNLASLRILSPDRITAAPFANECPHERSTSFRRSCRSVALLVTCLKEANTSYFQSQKIRWNNRCRLALSGHQEEKSMAKAAQQIGQASGQPKARDIAPQAKTEAGGADKQVTTTHDASDNLAGYRVAHLRALEQCSTSDPKRTLHRQK